MHWPRCKNGTFTLYRAATPWAPTAAATAAGGAALVAEIQQEVRSGANL